MDLYHFSDSVHQAVTQFFVWIGFGTSIGLLAKAIMPGRDPGGPLVTLALGISGSFIGCGVFAYFANGFKLTPISPLGLVMATAGAFVLLAFYRVLSGYWPVDGQPATPKRVAFFTPPAPHRRRRQTAVVVERESPLDEF